MEKLSSLILTCPNGSESFRTCNPPAMHTWLLGMGMALSLMSVSKADV